MQVEVLQFHPTEYTPTKLSGTMRVKLSIGIHILGVYIQKVGAAGNTPRYWVNLPSKTETDKRTGQKTRFPCIVMDTHEETKNLINDLVAAGAVFLDKWTQEFGESFLTQQEPCKEKEAPIPAPSSKVQALTSAAKQPIASSQKTVKFFVTPPPLKNPKTRSWKK